MAKANSGMISHADHGFLTMLEPDGGSPLVGARRRISGMNGATTTPASVARTPDFSTEIQSTAPGS